MMPAPADSPMHKDLWSRINMIAEEDSAREERDCGGKPSRLNLYLLGGHSVLNCWLIDGVNSLDDENIDVVTEDDGRHAHWIVPLSAIAAIHQRYPEEDK